MENRYIEEHEKLRKTRKKAASSSASSSYEPIEYDQNNLEALAILKTHSELVNERNVSTFDEIDVVLHLRKELNFPIGEKEPIPQDEIDIIAEMIRTVATDQESLMPV